MEHRIDKARLAMAHLFEVLNPEDEVFLVSFARTIPSCLQRMRTARNPRRAVVVISDGGDNDSRYSSKHLFAYAMEADVQIHALG